jgi:hypothetical protein
MRVDIALLASALFLQRFSLPFFREKMLSLVIVSTVLILIHQFASGRLLIQYDRLLWFLAVTMAATSSLLLNFESKMLTSYGLFVVTYFLFTFSRHSDPNQYKNTLRGFQFLILILSCIAIVQFPAQFVVDGRRLIMFYGIFPESLLPPPYLTFMNTIGTIGGSSLIKSNGMFLGEPSTMSQMAALAITIEVVEFRRPRYLVVLTLGLLLAYSGTGITVLLLCLPLAGLINSRAQLPAVVVGFVGVGLLATGIIDLSAFTSRVGEFDSTRASGFIRFVSPYWLAADYFRTASLFQFVFGNGPGGTGVQALASFYAGSASAWLKLISEYGLITALPFPCFLTSCFRRSRCPKPVVIALLYLYAVIGGLLDTSLLIIMVVLCTLNGPEPRRRRTDGASRYWPSVIAGSTGV